MAGSIDDLNRRLTQLANEISKSPRDLVTASARVYKVGITQKINAAAPGGRLRGVGKFNGGARKGARVGVKTITYGGTQAASAIVQATGPLHLLERDTKAHTVPRTAGSRRLRTTAGRLSHKREATGRSFSGRRVMFVPGVGFRTGPWQAGGSRGKHPFERGVRATENAAAISAAAAFTSAISHVFKG